MEAPWKPRLPKSLTAASMIFLTERALRLVRTEGRRLVKGLLNEDPGKPDPHS